MKTVLLTTIGLLWAALLLPQNNHRKSIFLEPGNLEYRKYRYQKGWELGGIGINITPKQNLGEVDPYTGLPTVAPNGSYTIMIGKDDTGAEIDRVIYRFKVTPDKSILYMMYAIVLEDPKHEPHQQPKLELRVLDENDKVIDRECGYYLVAAGPNNGFKQGAGIVQYKPWTMVAVDLKAYIGRNIALDFVVYDCTETGHFGYAYLDAWFGKEGIEVKYCKNGDYAHFMAPPAMESYEWSDGSTGQVLKLKSSPMRQTTYSCRMVGKTGCVLNLSATVDPGNEMIMVGEPTITHQTCNGLNNGSIKIPVSGGSPPYHYKWSSGATTSDIANLSPGTYSVSITDQKGCEGVIENITVKDRSLNLTMPPTGNSVKCAGGSEGGNSMEVSGGAPPYSINLDGKEYLSDTTLTVVNFQGLQVGSYTVDVKDTAGCTTNAVFTINGPPSLVVSAANILHASCFGAKDGSISLDISGGTSPYSTVWEDGSNNPTRNNLGVGSYMVVVTDNNGCTATLEVNIQQPLPIDFTVKVKDANCYGSATGMATVEIQTLGNFIVEWSNGAIGSLLENVVAGNYRVKIRDEAHCMEADVVIEQPAPLAATPHLPNHHGFTIACHGGVTEQFSVFIEGGTGPYWVVFLGNITAQEGTTARPGSKRKAKKAEPNLTDSILILEGLKAGIFRLHVKDANGCEQVFDFTITEPDELAVSITAPKHVFCFGKSDAFAHSTVTGGVPPYQYKWSFEGAIISNEPNLDSIPKGEYMLVVIDANGCTVTGTINILGRPKLQVVINKRTGAWKAINGGGKPYKIISQQETKRGYVITISDALGCTCTDTYTRFNKLPEGTEVRVRSKKPPQLRTRRVYCYNFSRTSFKKRKIFRT